MMREIAWRVFAAEFNDSTYTYTEGGERSPSYVVTPLGARVNRLFVVGVITDVENVGSEDEPLWRSRLSDPSGTFMLSAGQYQPEAAQVLAKLNPPAFAAVVGKSRVYSPEGGVVYVSIRPELVKVVGATLRDYWILEACNGMRHRIDAMKEALAMDPPTVKELVSLGYGMNLAEGIILALEHYGEVDVGRYEDVLVEALRYLIPDYEGMEELPIQQEAIPEEETEDTGLEDEVLAIIESLDKNGNGAAWDEILDGAKKAGIRKEELEEVVNDLLDKGLVYEPVLGRMKRI